MDKADSDRFNRDIQIFELIEQGVPISEVCEKFKLSKVRVRHIYQEVFAFLYKNGNILIEKTNKPKKRRNYKENPRYIEIAEECFKLKEKGWSDKRIARTLNTKPVTVRKAIEHYKNA